jgi:hypothetical protein
MDVTKPYKFMGFGAMDATKPYEFIGFGAKFRPKSGQSRQTGQNQAGGTIAYH